MTVCMKSRLVVHQCATNFDFMQDFIRFFLTPLLPQLLKSKKQFFDANFDLLFPLVPFK